MKIVASIKITVDRLQPGLYVRLPVKWNEHPFLFNSFKIKSQDQIQLIKHLGIQHVFLNPSLSDAQPLPRILKRMLLKPFSHLLMARLKNSGKKNKIGLRSSMRIGAVFKPVRKNLSVL